MHGPKDRPAPTPPASAAAANSPARVAPWLWTAAAPAAAGSALVVLVAAGWRPLLAVDRTVADRLHAQALAHPAWTEANRILSDWVWDTVTMRLLVLAAAVWVWLRGERLLAVWCAGTAAAGTGVQQGLKSLVDRERPRWQHPVDSAHFSAMPSGHVLTAALACTLLVWLVQRSGAGAPLRAAVLAAAWLSVAGVCLTRLVLGVHWLTDTLAGAALGVALAAVAAGSFNSLENRGGWRRSAGTRTEADAG
ncbi:phosphatase PAP2 family protein [Streptomyces sp. HNM0575]|uniref:phosphatase PAP2 family protein n=1 Tax=Streptomyces sp. HNM0575 TaxID=2716338 RepID=UPI00145F8549|nr:phosphatase PAP2 family protein [Streptomyces sp. HNM0575]NLU73618.1 phosphatase PAP2 family protein [Streptomyces sp. HNM0575]